MNDDKSLDRRECLSETKHPKKDGSNQSAVPHNWRATLVQIVEAFKQGDFTLQKKISRVYPISRNNGVAIAANIEAYGAKLITLPDETWQTSVCQWYGNHWDVLVDLYTTDESPSDLVLHVYVLEEVSDYAFDVHLVYVP